MKKTNVKIALALALAFTFSLVPVARAQNVNGFYSSVAQTLTYIQGQYIFTPLPQATITVCNYPASVLAPGQPCTNLATLYADATISTPASSIFAADAQGNFSFWAGQGYYQYNITNLATNVTTGPYTVVLGGSGSGGGGATLPYPGLVFATGPYVGTVATSQQIVSAINTTPTTQFAASLLPLATSSAFGAVEPDNVSITISNGIISSTPPTVSIPATNFVLKGTGSANTATAAGPGVDYVLPTGSITGTSANLSGTPTLPNGTSAVTQTTGDNTSKLATDAFVLANTAGTTPSFTNITTGTNTTAAMVCGTGCTLNPTGTGRINATLVNSNSFPASGGFTSGGIPYFSSTSALGTSAVLTLNGVLVGGGAGNPPTTITPSTTTSFALFATGTAPAFRAIVAGDIPTLNQNTTGTAANLAGCTPVPSVPGAVCVWNGSGWALFGGNTSSTAVFTESSVGVPSWSSSGTGSGTVNSGTANHLTYYPASSATVSSDPRLDDGATTVSTLTYTGSGGITATGAAGMTAPTFQTSGTGSGILALSGSSSGTATVTVGAAAGTPTLTLPTTSGTLTETILSGTAAMPTSPISSGTCSAAVTVAAAGVVTTDTISFNPNVDPTSITGYAPSSTGSLYIWPYPTSGNVNFKVCNNTASGITASALTINWRVVR